ncbi:CobW family GTP-binding protein [Glaciecola siphonariae]|uniref:CobW family GTP-binding protein n=1 Tax=Glaciecola siphonariae TaxID=521012 RepID=A0ABV9LZ53_9ALTE
MEIISAVPTNIITGALGAGKTTFIKALLKTKPKHERWAVLVNEFGEVGIDGAILHSCASKDSSDKQTIFIREIPGGCMCCASGLPMQIALNQLLAIAKPHRLLVEPTGLGHPKEVVEVFSSEHYRDVISLKSTFCLSDARKLKDVRWREHPTFKEQFEVADYIIATKIDRYEEADMGYLKEYLKTNSIGDTEILTAEHGKIMQNTTALLSQASHHSLNKKMRPLAKSHPKQHAFEDNESNEPATDVNAVFKQNKSDGFVSLGWIWPSRYCFNHDSLIRTLTEIDAIRIKALMITNQGIFTINNQGDEWRIYEYDEAMDSRLELIVKDEALISQLKTAIDSLVSIQSV